MVVKEKKKKKCAQYEDDLGEEEEENNERSQRPTARTQEGDACTRRRGRGARLLN